MSRLSVDEQAPNEPTQVDAESATSSSTSQPSPPILQPALPDPLAAVMVQLGQITAQLASMQETWLAERQQAREQMEQAARLLALMQQTHEQQLRALAANTTATEAATRAATDVTVRAEMLATPAQSLLTHAQQFERTATTLQQRVEPLVTSVTSAANESRSALASMAQNARGEMKSLVQQLHAAVKAEQRPGTVIAAAVLGAALAAGGAAWFATQPVRESLDTNTVIYGRMLEQCQQNPPPPVRKPTRKP